MQNQDNKRKFIKICIKKARYVWVSLAVFELWLIFSGTITAEALLSSHLKKQNDKRQRQTHTYAKQYSITHIFVDVIYFYWLGFLLMLFFFGRILCFCFLRSLYSVADSNQPLSISLNFYSLFNSFLLMIDEISLTPYWLKNKNCSNSWSSISCYVFTEKFTQLIYAFESSLLWRQRMLKSDMQKKNSKTIEDFALRF